MQSTAVITLSNKSRFSNLLVAVFSHISSLLYMRIFGSNIRICQQGAFHITRASLFSSEAPDFSSPNCSGFCSEAEIRSRPSTLFSHSFIECSFFIPAILLLQSVPSDHRCIPQCRLLWHQSSTKSDCLPAPCLLQQTDSG